MEVNRGSELPKQDEGRICQGVQGGNGVKRQWPNESTSWVLGNWAKLGA
jgi:hypothetical protein